MPAKVSRYSSAYIYHDENEEKCLDKALVAKDRHVSSLDAKVGERCTLAELASRLSIRDCTTGKPLFHRSTQSRT